MTTATSPCTGTTRTAAKPPASAAHACCTELECFEKPRFFCGQLLTDVDLEATVDYIAAKNRLHNRYLVGTGVACGLAVRCDPCNRGSVVVEAGYAIDCTGNDIVVCVETTFDVQGYLDRRRKEEQADCGQGKVRVPAGCAQLETEYCLVLSYEERPGKPVNALVRDNGCRANRCEPSRTLERFRLDLIDRKTAEKLNVRPSVWSRMSECLAAESAKLAAHRAELAKATTTQQVQLIHNRMRADLIDFAKRSGLTHCDLLEKICKVDGTPGRPPVIDGPDVIPINPDGPLREGGVSASATFETGFFAPDELSVLYGRLLADCACNALLVPCPPCCDDSGYVLLACLKVDQGKVVEICNTVRTQLVTGPSVRYWAQPLFDGIGRFFESICCPPPAAAATDDAGASFDRFERAISLARAYGSSFSRSSTSPIHGARTLELLQRPAEEVQILLSHLSIRSTITRAATVEDAYSFDNLRDFSFEIPFNARVELVVAPDNTVAAIRTLRNVAS